MKTTLILVSLVSILFCSCSKKIDSPTTKNVTLPIGSDQSDDRGFSVLVLPVDSWNTFATETSTSDGTILSMKLKVSIGFTGQTLNRNEFFKIGVHYKDRIDWISDQYALYTGQTSITIEVKTPALKGEPYSFYSISSTISF